MMARSTTRSNLRPDTLMQDRICQVDETSCNARPDHTSGSKTEVSGPARDARFTLRSRHRQPAPACPFGAISGSHSILVATGEHWLGWSFGQPGLPQSLFVSREVFGT